MNSITYRYMLPAIDGSIGAYQHKDDQFDLVSPRRERTSRFSVSHLLTAYYVHSNTRVPNEEKKESQKCLDIKVIWKAR